MSSSPWSTVNSAASKIQNQWRESAPQRTIRTLNVLIEYVVKKAHENLIKHDIDTLWSNEAAAVLDMAAWVATGNERPCNIVTWLQFFLRMNVELHEYHGVAGPQSPEYNVPNGNRYKRIETAYTKLRNMYLHQYWLPELPTY